MAIVIGLEGFPPFFMAGLRFIIAAIVLIGYSIYKGEGIPKKRSLIKNAFLGLVVLALGNGLLIWSEQYIASGYASVLVATLPIWFVMLDRSNWKFYFTNPFILVGIVMGFAGIVLLFYDQLTTELPEEMVKMQLIASSLVILGGVCWVAGTLYNRTRPAAGSMYQSLGWQLFAGAVFSFLISSGLGEFSTLPNYHATWESWAAVLYLSLVSNVIVFVAYTWLLSILPSAIVGTYAYINPIVAVLLGWLLLDEVISSHQLLGMAIILISAIMINLNRRKGKELK